MDLKSFAETYWSMQEKKLDPVGKEDGDVDNDGDKDSSDSYLMKRRAAIKKAMKKEEVEQEENDNYVEAYLDELSKKTLGSYIKKATSDRSTDLGNAKNMKHAAKLVKKGEKREKEFIQQLIKLLKKKQFLSNLPKTIEILMHLKQLFHILLMKNLLSLGNKQKKL